MPRFAERNQTDSKIAPAFEVAGIGRDHLPIERSRFRDLASPLKQHGAKPDRLDAREPHLLQHVARLVQLTKADEDTNELQREKWVRWTYCQSGSQMGERLRKLVPADVQHRHERPQTGILGMRVDRLPGERDRLLKVSLPGELHRLAGNRRNVRHARLYSERRRPCMRHCCRNRSAPNLMPLA